MKIAIPIRARTLQEAEKMLSAAESMGDFVEIWLDELDANEAADLIRLSKKPVIVVCKAAEERGNFVGSERERVERLIAAASVNTRFVDCGMHTDQRLIDELRKRLPRTTKLILSHHDWDRTPDIETLEGLCRSGFERGADIVKIATTIVEWSDNVTLFELTKRMGALGGGNNFGKRTRITSRKIIIVGMGERGKMSRLGCPLLGSFLTYAALDKQHVTAPGQITVKEWENYMKVKI